MADDYTDDEVREAFQQGAGILPPFYDKGYEYELQKRGDAFDAWLRERDAALIESLTDDMEGGFNRETLNLERRQIKRWLRERARQVREGEA